MQKGRYHIGFYSLVMTLNVIVAIMFRVVTLPPPAQVLYEVKLPSVPRIVSAISGTPTRIVIDSIAMDLPVGVGTYDPATDSWTLSDDQAYYADNSVPVNDSNGMTLIYGHARSSVFGALPNLQVGAIADIYTDNGRVFHYRYQSLSQVDPSDVSIFTSSGPPGLTLQTCAGAWDMYRSLYSFVFIGEVAV
jgi:LPXTG-site transpeptidase (sortase) family protein